MTEQCLSNKNENATVREPKKFSELNKALHFVAEYGNGMGQGYSRITMLKLMNSASCEQCYFFVLVSGSETDSVLMFPMSFLKQSLIRRLASFEAMEHTKIIEHLKG